MTLNQQKETIMIASLKSETMGCLINRIPGLRLLISNLPGSGLRTHVESLGMSTSILKALPGKLDIKRHSPCILYLYTGCNVCAKLLCTVYARCFKSVELLLS